MSKSPENLGNHEEAPFFPNIDTGDSEDVFLIPFSELISFACNDEISQYYFSSFNFNISKTCSTLETKAEKEKLLPNDDLFANANDTLLDETKSINPAADDCNSKEVLFQGDAGNGANEDGQISSAMVLTSSDCPQNEIKMGLKKKNVQKRKRTETNNDNDAGDVVPSKQVLLSSTDETDTEWIVEGVVVKTLKYGRPMGSILKVSEDKTACTIQFFSGWKADVFTKHITPVSANDIYCVDASK